MKSIIFAGILMLLGLSALAQNTRQLLTDYIQIKNSLVNSDAQSASEAIGDFYQTLKGEENFAEKTDLLRFTEKLMQAPGLEKQRAGFNGLSTTMWTLVSRSGNTGQPVYYQYCPMKKAYWLSTEKEIKNPYYGSSMLTCGRIAETHP